MSGRPGIEAQADIAGAQEVIEVIEARIREDAIHMFDYTCMGRIADVLIEGDRKGKYRILR